MLPPLFPKAAGDLVFGFDHGFSWLGKAPGVEHNASEIPGLMADSQEPGVEQQFRELLRASESWTQNWASMRRQPYCPKSLRR